MAKAGVDSDHHSIGDTKKGKKNHVCKKKKDKRAFLFGAT
jgi:hypothetical protein